MLFRLSSAVANRLRYLTTGLSLTKTAWSAGRTSLFMLFSWYFLLFDSIWHVVQIGIGPWTLRMSPGYLWKLGKGDATFSVTSLCSPSPRQLEPAVMRSSVPYTSDGPSGIVCKIWFQLFPCSNVNSNTYLHSSVLYLTILTFSHLRADAMAAMPDCIWP